MLRGQPGLHILPQLPGEFDRLVRLCFGDDVGPRVLHHMAATAESVEGINILPRPADGQLKRLHRAVTMGLLSRPKARGC